VGRAPPAAETTTVDRRFEIGHLEVKERFDLPEEQLAVITG
jgi:hypothetical protein